MSKKLLPPRFNHPPTFPKHFFQALISFVSFALIILTASPTFAQGGGGGNCANIQPFCAGNQSLIFANCNDQDPNCDALAEPGPNYGCLSLPRYPAWFYLQIEEGGRLDFEIIQNTSFDPSGNPNGADLDVDFICWGPFSIDDDFCDYSLLQSQNQIACSYSASHRENFTIQNAQPGEFYVLVLTNFSRRPGFIKLEQTGGDGSTNCDIVYNCSVNIDQDDTILCDVVDFEITTTISGPVESYEWFKDGVLIAGENTSSLIVTETANYEVVIDGTDCLDPVSDQVNVTFIDSVDITTDLPSQVEICLGDAYPELDATPTNQNIDLSLVTYEWRDGNGTVVSTNGSYTPSFGGTYEVTITYAPCSEETFSVDVVVVDPPTLDLGTDQILCSGSSFEIIPSITGGTGQYTYLWNTGETTPTIRVSDSGVYTLTVTSGPCIVTDSIDIAIYDLEISLGEDFKLCPKETYVLEAITEAEDVTFEWYLDNDLLLGETGSSIEIIFSDREIGSRTYTVTIYKEDCSQSASVDVSTYDIGNCVISRGISPGSDGFNDSLDLTFLNDRTGISKLQIFNRLGKLVFDQNNYTNQWRGQTNDGQDLPTGTYFYVIDLSGVDSVYGSQATGWIYLNQEAN